MVGRRNRVYLDYALGTCQRCAGAKWERFILLQFSELF